MEYNLDFSSRLLDSAEYMLENLQKVEANRVILYLSCLSMEISFKSTLEKAGYSPVELKKYGHQLNELLKLTAKCRFKSNNRVASTIRAKRLSVEFNNTVGSILSTDKDRVSGYPNDIRYGSFITHYPPVAMFECAKVVNSWCREHYDDLLISNN